MTESKNALQSETILGAVAVLASTGATMAGYDIGDTGGWVNQGAALIGALMAIHGRVKAVKKIRLL